MHFKILAAGAITSCVLLSACSADEIPLPEEELYAREFVKEFGITDPDHDYNMAKQSGIKVVTASPTDLKVYAEVKGKTYLFAEARQVSGTTAIPFALPKGVDEVTVKVGNHLFKTPIDQTLDLRNVSRTIEGSTTDTTLDELTWRISEETIIPTMAVNDHINIYPEGGDNLIVGNNSFYFIADGKEHTIYPFYWNTNAYHILGIYTIDNNDTAVPHDLYYSKSGELTVSTDYVAEIDKIVEHPAGEINLFYTATQWDNPVPGVTNTNGGNTDPKTIYGSEPTWGGADGEKTYSTAVFTTEHGYISKVVFSKNIFTLYETVTTAYTEHIQKEGNPGTWNKPTGNTAFSPGENTYIKTKGITYSLPKGTPYGFYIKVGHGSQSLDNNKKGYDYVCFSHSYRNKKYIAKVNYKTQIGETTQEVDVNYRIRNYPWPDNEWKIAGKDVDPLTAWAYASWSVQEMNGQKYSIFGFEDCAHGFHDDACDLNDIMFCFANGEAPSNIVLNDKDPVIPDDPEVFEWIIAAEDLGGTYDWDFNDAVFSVKAKTVVTDDNTATELTVKPLASGGIMPVYIMFDGAIDGTDGCYHIGPELHQWFGSSSLKPINVIGTTADTEATNDITFTVSGAWSLNTHADQGNWTSASRSMGGFWLLADPKATVSIGSDVKVTPTTDSFDESTHKVIAPQFGEAYEAPQMFCLTGDWQWPQEEQPINEVYPSFDTWLTNAETPWYGDGVEFDQSRTVSRK